MDVTERFSDLVDVYDRARPRYPRALGEWARARGLAAGRRVADVGAGTGILSALLLELGCEVVLVEPSGAMRARAQANLGGDPRASFVSGRAEATGLEPDAVDWITCGQAFHWFDVAAARREFRRVLRPGGRVLLVWNDRRADDDAVMAEYERLLADWSVDYAETSYRRVRLGETIGRFFDGRVEEVALDNEQTLNEDGFLARLFSSSYMPRPDDPRRPGAVAAARAVFARRARGDAILLRYYTRAYCGSVGADADAGAAD